jgi:hypothetical protein
MRMSLRLLFALTTFSVLVIPVSASAEYFFDQGFQSAVVRTDYDAPDQGTIANPMTMSDADVLYPCSDLLLVFPCIEPTFNISNPESAPLYYSQAFPWSFNGGDTASNFWVLSLNNEPWWKHDA